MAPQEYLIIIQHCVVNIIISISEVYFVHVGDIHCENLQK